MKKIKVFSGTSNVALAKSICEGMDEPLGEIYHHTFPSGEKYCQYQENIRDCDVYIVQSGYPNPNDALMETMIMADAARRASAKKITLVMPYFPYARQDRKSKSRTPITARLVADMIECSGVNRLITMDLHCGQIQGFFKIPVDHLYSFPTICDYIKNDVDVVVSPDTGAIKRCAAIADTIKTDFAFINKKRVSDNEVEVSSVNGDVKDRNVMIVDDMTESAGTLVQATKICLENGAKTVRTAVTHGLLNESGYSRLNANTGITEFMVTNTVNQIEYQSISGGKFTIIDIAPTFSKAIKRCHCGESVSDLFAIGGF